jgi:hypothetical protein
MSSEEDQHRAYVLIEVQPGQEKEFTDFVMSQGMTRDKNVERMDFVLGGFDAIIALRGTMKEIDTKVLELRKSPLIRRTETLICFEIFSWEDVSGRMG